MRRLTRVRSIVGVAGVVALAACRRHDRNLPPPAFRPIETGAPTTAAPSTGCGRTEDSPRGETLTTSSGRTIHVWGPRRYDPAKPYPVVVAFHGIGSNGRQFESWFKMEDFVGGEAFTVYPDAKRIWDLDGAKDLDFFEAALDLLAGKYCVDRARVLAFGFSFGGKLVHHLGCKRSAKVKAIAVGDGSWHAEDACGRVPVLVTHRTRDHDELLPWGRDAARRWAEIDGCVKTSDVVDAAHGCVTYRGCTPSGAVTFCEDDDDNPTWPRAWHHTVREEYRALTWAWFQSVR
jgi:polyhydroxybutyrate depolymerase